MRIPEWVPILGKGNKLDLQPDQKAAQERLLKLTETLKTQKLAQKHQEVHKAPPSPQDLWDDSRGEVMSSKKPLERTMTNAQLADALPKVEVKTKDTPAVPAKAPDRAA